MRTFFTTILLLTTILHSTAQVEGTRYFNRDQLTLELLSNQWLEAPEHVKLNPRSLAFNIHLMYNLLGRNRNIALAAGFGFSSENYIINAIPEKIDHTLQFTEIDPSLKYKSNKMRFNTLELPVEIRLRTNKNNRNKSWKLYLGAKGGYLYQSMHKYNGDNPEKPDEHLKQKTYHIPYTEQFSYGLTAKLGYGDFLISGYYALTNRFKENKAHELVPLMIGITYYVY